MFAINSVLVFFFMTILMSNCQRRVQDGIKLSVDKKYVAYLTKAPQSKLSYDHWICGGAIVSSQFVVTSAACVGDVDFLYVIAGYRKYVPDQDLELDQCTSKMKKKVIYTCFPLNYTLDWGNLSHWSNIDIALVRVESPFDFDDDSYEKLCSYKPTTIAINFDAKYQRAGLDSLVFGWGHTTHWRMPEDPENYNQELLNYGSTLILDKSTCKERYEDYTNMDIVIENYMICTLAKGNIDDAGRAIQQNIPIGDGCTSKQQKLLGFEGVSCEKNAQYSDYDDDTRRNNKKSNHTLKNMTLSDFNKTATRRSGICQNDHGGPLITWAGSREILIGVASVFKVTEKYECMGPYLYTSTFSTGNFLDCILKSEYSGSRRLRNEPCDLAARERGYNTVERSISWKNHPAGAADNEK